MSELEKIAKKLHTSPKTLRYAMQQGLIPFGRAVKVDKGYAYIFFPLKVKEYVGELEESV